MKRQRLFCFYVVVLCSLACSQIKNDQIRVSKELPSLCLISDNVVFSIPNGASNTIHVVSERKPAWSFIVDTKIRYLHADVGSRIFAISEDGRVGEVAWPKSPTGTSFTFRQTNRSAQFKVGKLLTWSSIANRQFALDESGLLFITAPSTLTMKAMQIPEFPTGIQNCQIVVKEIDEARVYRLW